MDGRIGAKTINVVIVGAGTESIPLLRQLHGLAHCRILGIADERPEAPGLAVAKEFGIPADRDLVGLVKEKEVDLLIDLSGSPVFHKTLEKILPPRVSVIDGASAELLFELVRERERLLKVETAHKLTQQYSKFIEETNQKLDEKILELSLLNETSVTFSAAFDERNISSLIYSVLKRKIPFSVYALLLVENGRWELVLTAHQEIPEELKEEIRFRIVERYAQTVGKPMDPEKVPFLEKVRPSPTPDKEPVEGPLKAFHTAPLIVQDRTLGMMGMAFCRDLKLSSEDERFFNILTSQVALFVENDRIRQTITTERNRLEAILKSMANAVLAFDRFGNLVLVNPVAEIFLGIAGEEVFGKPLREALPQESLKSLWEALAGEKGEFLAKETRITNFREGTTRTVKANLTRVRDHLNNIIGTVLVMEDITKEKEIDRMKTEFVSTTSHEIRTPLASIKESVALVFDGSTGGINETQRKFLGIAQRNIARLTSLINNVLDLSKIESGKMTLERTEVDLNKIAQDVKGTFEIEAGKKRIGLQVKLEEGLPLLQADPDRITQVLTNLVSNAVKFTPEGGQVTMATSYYGSDRKFLQASVRDTGIGIDKKDFERLFKKFGQLDASMMRRVGGTGLGLAISQEIVELHGGRIWVESDRGKGSTFSFILPVESKEGAMGKKKILVIDDEPDLCATVKKRLEASDFSVLTVLSGQEGLEEAKDYRPDLIVLDLMMPAMDGFEVCKQLKKDTETSSIPVVVLTALEQEDAAKRALSMGAQGYLVKPFEPESLLFTIKEFLK